MVHPQQKKALIKEFQHACSEGPLLDSHPPDIHCRLCEEVPIRTIVCAIPLLTDRQLRRALDEVQDEVNKRDLEVLEQFKALPDRIAYALASRVKSIRWLWDQLRLVPGLPTSYATVHSYVNGFTTPVPAWVHAAAQVLKVDHQWLMLGEGKPPDFGVSVD
jgi:hypothetical protein